MSTLEAESTFQAFAAHYDRFTSCDNYELLSQILDELLKGADVPGKSLLDVACGTGKSTMAMAARGYQVSGCDISEAMLDRARAKPGAACVRFLRADMRSLDASLGVVDVVTCIDDAVNFLLTDEDLLAAFRSAARVLAPGGLYLFDTNTLSTYRNSYASDEIRDHEDVFFAWKGRCTPAHPAGGRAEADIYSYHRQADDRWSRAHVRHVQRHYPVEIVEEMLGRAGFVSLAAYGLYRTGALRERVDESLDGKTIHLALKPQS